MIEKRFIEHLRELTQKRYDDTVFKTPETRQERLNKEVELYYAGGMIEIYDALINDEYEIAERLAKESNQRYNLIL